MFLVIGSLAQTYPSTSLALSCLHLTFLGQQKLGISPYSTTLNFTSLSSGARKPVLHTALSPFPVLHTFTRHFWGSRNVLSSLRSLGNLSSEPNTSIILFGLLTFPCFLFFF
ncbi:hypothetical protein CTAM01_15379 [Colletotrichum tamarilloi]|uniref:Uncharacterized protein n=1 Tax=Colletotrichum tamarilloi TaxID=1209934 RepID=A0ABQ9QLN5_9PEZI|nr:uncharacterized protein CTAM01_15379 [Colletotrichum tamarilloi]KAK1476651.1 hypothetical protein CTAM01_15379 [Colletotrichum tamarilloi]